jgi:hypothetical protein
MTIRSSFFCLGILLVLAVSAIAADEPQVSADAGPCWIAFTVTDAAHKPLYNAKIHTIVRYGFMSMRKTELELSTDANGKGKFTGLPQSVKRPLDFDITYRDMAKTVSHDPGTNCHQTMDVELGSK